MADPIRGADAIDALLRERTTDLRRVGTGEFRRWLEAQLPGWRRDPAFEQRERIRDLRRAHPRLRELERERRSAAAADAATPEGARLRRMEEELHGMAQAIAGLSAALAEAAGEERRAALAEKLGAFHARRSALQSEHDARSEASLERSHLLRLDDELASLRHATGADAAQARLDELSRGRGRRSGQSGEGFEEEAVRAVREHVIPELGGAPLTVLTGVTLGTAGTELDQVIVRPGAPVEVLAVVEAKHNPNDLGHGFTRRQRDLAWLSGHRAAYDPERHVTRAFPAGHFDRAVEHAEAGATYRFDPASFRRFHPDPATGHYLDGLYFVTRPTPLAGLTGGALGRLRHRAATDTRFTLTDDTYLDELLAWIRTLAEPIEAPDVLRLFAPHHARQILFLHTETQRARR